MKLLNAASGEELFVGDTPEEVERLARAKHPDEEAFEQVDQVK
jgi:hypothetical protein